MRYDIFLKALLWHLDELAPLVAEQWPAVRQRLMVLLADVLTDTSEPLLGLRVNRIFRAFEGTGAHEFVRQLFARSSVAEGAGAARRSFRAVDAAPATVFAEPDPYATVRAAAELADAVTASVASVPSDDPAPPDRRINAWLEEPRALQPGDRRNLRINVGRPVAGSVLQGPDAVVPLADVQAGLSTDWIVETSDFVLESDDPEVRVLSSAQAWVARFALALPAQGDSATRQLWVTPLKAGDGRLQVLIFATSQRRRELYRQLDLTIGVQGVADVHDQLACGPIEELNLRTTHEWTTPPERLTVTVMSGSAKAAVNGTVGTETVDGEIVEWPAQPATLAGPIRNTREAAEKFRAKWERYLNDIDPADLLHRLAHFQPTYDWRDGRRRADPAHEAAWRDASASTELRNLAIHAHELYESVFPTGSELRRWIEGLAPGSRLDLQWTEAAGPGFVPNIPWGLMYLPDPPAADQPVDALGFLGMRLRLAYRVYKGTAKGERALGGVGQSRQAFCLYWGAQAGDETGLEAAWQRQHFARWPNGLLIPVTPASADARAEVLQLFNGLGAAPLPTPVIYLYCQASVGDGERPVLRFGSTTAVADVLPTVDLLGHRRLVDEPLVFANACATSASYPYVANLLEQNLFRRGCRSYIGTETKVPIQMASRFATVFFEFFNRRVDPKPMAVGEAVAQSRLFLFKEYANIGGLLYAQLNQYDLYMADEQEVRSLRVA